MKRKIMNEKGFSLVITLLAIVLITILGLSILILNHNSLKTSKKEQVDQSVFYIAESGITYRLLEIESEVIELYNTLFATFKIKFDKAKVEDKEKLVNDFHNDFYNGLDVKYNNKKTLYRDVFKSEGTLAEVVTIKYSDNPRKYKLESTGDIDNKKRTVSQIIEIKLDSGGSGGSGVVHGVHTFGKITLTGGSKIFGSAASASGEFIANNGGCLSDINGNCVNKITKSTPPSLIEKFREFQNKSSQVSYPPTVPDIIDSQGNFNGDHWKARDYQIIMSGDMKFRDFKLAGGNPITIDTGVSDKNLYVEKLSLDNGTKIKVNGVGKLNIYVENDIKLAGGFNNNSSNKIYIYYNGDKKLDFGNDINIYGGFYTPNAVMYLGGGAKINGTIIAKEFHGSNNAQIISTGDSEGKPYGGLGLPKITFDVLFEK